MNYRHEWKHEISYGDLLVLRRRLLAVAKRGSQNSYSSESQNSVPSQTDRPFESFGQIPQKAQDGNMFTAKPQEDMQKGQISQGPMTGAMPEGNNMPSGQIPGGMQGGLTGSSDDVLLKYIDDSFDSYSNIFDNAKTDITDADKSRLISSLKNLSSGEDLENTLDIDAVIRYFAVHNFVLNFDSYTGSMIHNYYLYEQDGQMEMIPWDYNLAFGGFQSASDATALVNYPIDSPVSGGSIQDRPMIAWIFENEQYTNLYHEYFSEFICQYFDSGYFETMMDDVIQMISPYVEKDPTKFCTYEEFETGAYTLKQFCLLRAKSIKGQLSGEISSTSENRESDSLIDAGDLQISNMGAMSGGMAARGEREQSFSSGSGGQDLEESPPFDLQNSTASPQPPWEAPTTQPVILLAGKTPNRRTTAIPTALFLSFPTKIRQAPLRSLADKQKEQKMILTDRRIKRPPTNNKVSLCHQLYGWPSVLPCFWQELYLRCFLNGVNKTPLGVW